MKNNPILIDSLLWRERKRKEQRPFCLVSILSALVHFIIWHLLSFLGMSLGLTAHDANRLETVCWMSTFSPKYSTCVFDLKLFFNQYQRLFSQKYNIVTLNSFSITSIPSSSHVNYLFFMEPYRHELDLKYHFLSCSLFVFFTIILF